MSEMINATYNLLDTLDNSDIIKKIVYYKELLSTDQNTLNLIKKYQKESNNERKIMIKKELFNNDNYKNYLHYYNELSLIILKINKKYHEYTNTKTSTNGGINHE